MFLYHLFIFVSLYYHLWFILKIRLHHFMFQNFILACVTKPMNILLKITAQFIFWLSIRLLALNVLITYKVNNCSAVAIMNNRTLVSTILSLPRLLISSDSSGAYLSLIRSWSKLRIRVLFLACLLFPSALLKCSMKRSLSLCRLHC